jgi:hypothetical protein
MEHVAEEGITSISHGNARVTGLSGADVAAVLDLSNILRARIEEQIKDEQTRLLEIVRRMPLDEVLAGGQKAFVTSDTDTTKRRKK